MENDDEEESYARSSGDMLCKVCIQRYDKHPVSKKKTEMGENLRRICNGELIKL